VDGARVPHLAYEFSPTRGSVLWTSAGRPFWGHLGGYTDSVTGRGGDGGQDGSPFVNESNYPKAAKKMRPEWVVEDGTPCLKFDGLGTFIALPQESLPRRGSFRLSFEIKPERVDKPQILFAHHGHYIGSLVVRLDNGLLSGSFVNERGQKFQLKPGLAVQPGRWNRIEIIYDLATMRFRVNGQESEAMPCVGPGLYNVTCAVGGFGDPGAKGGDTGRAGWFQGYLRALRIVHNGL
jgi:hypothetical protein